MILYIARGIIVKNIIEFYKNPNGSKPVLDFLEALKIAGETDSHFKTVSALVVRGIEVLRDYGVQHCIQHLATLSHEDGTPYTTTIVKDLKGYVPLLEFRINWRPSALRIVFIEYPYQDDNYLVLMRAIIKGTTTDPAFEAIRDEAFNLIPDFIQDPKKYINLPGE